ncbi:Alpha/beta hydrolase family-domain-containing protein [Syncephalastrum racemosum]|uniref:Alpha/beta hydrolase family-domain-containing protein n=1 Tax=Syncephalastrum racemosum TaxID=13706 RepID=A0A1X2HP38_SYNRA|nr:Alpha/beta hydrolase family-domain-containing protein [Syncephalastrum racemosum]
MPRLLPVQSFTIPVHNATVGHDCQRLAVEKHVFPSPQPPKQTITFLWSHANGFHKESMHPLVSAFIRHLRTQPQYDDVAMEVFLWDARNHGDSARLNEGILQPDYLWFDNAMDTLQVIQELKIRKCCDFLIGVGHSFGATSMVLCEFLYPNTFDGLALMEPIIKDSIPPTAIRALYPIMASKNRRDTWPSREECLRQLAPRPFWKAFDPEVLKLYVEYGMYETPEGSIKLKCPKEQEFRIFDVTPYSQMTAHKVLRLLTIPVHIIYALGSHLLKPEESHIMTGQNRLVSVDFIEGSHMVPNEKPKDMALFIAPIVQSVLLSRQSLPSQHLEESKL